MAGARVRADAHQNDVAVLLVEAAERFRARYGRAPERGELRNLALENRRSKELTTRSDLKRAWTQAGRGHGFGPDEAVRLIGASERPATERKIEDRVEAKLTESDFQTREARIVEAYRDFDEVFERELLPRVEIRTARRRAAIEFAEEFTQEWEAAAAEDDTARAFQASLVARAREAETAVPGYAGYQLIRNVLAAYAEGCSFCVIHDQRRPDLREAWFAVMAAVKSAQMRVRCKVLTWQELAGLAPEGVREFLNVKYGIAAPGCGS